MKIKGRIKKLESLTGHQQGQLHFIICYDGENPEEVKNKYCKENSVKNGDRLFLMDLSGDE